MKKYFFIIVLSMILVGCYSGLKEGAISADGATNSSEIFPEDVRICAQYYAPVCGVDGNTYSNSCAAGDIKIDYEGRCIDDK